MESCRRDFFIDVIVYMIIFKNNQLIISPRFNFIPKTGFPKARVGLPLTDVGLPETSVGLPKTG